MEKDEDKSQKTEEPTPKKMQDARQKGNIPISRELTQGFSVIGILLSFVVAVQFLATGFIDRIEFVLGSVGEIDLEVAADAVSLGYYIQTGFWGFIAPLVALYAVFGVAGVLLQSKPALVFERIKFKNDRISPIGGFKRIFGPHGLMEFFRAAFKFTVVGAIVFLLVVQEFGEFVRYISVDPVQLPAEALSLATRLVAAVCLSIILLVALDVVWTRWQWRRELRMSRREVKDELKQMEGDPIVRAKVRSLIQDRGRRRMVGRVPEATVLITNPTHYAVALYYERERCAAPVVLAKGRDRLALRIREIAETAGVPIVEDKALARALFDAVEPDSIIPQEFYKAVAKILYYLQDRN